MCKAIAILLTYYVFHMHVHVPTYTYVHTGLLGRSVAILDLLATCLYCICTFYVYINYKAIVRYMYLTCTHIHIVYTYTYVQYVLHRYYDH